MNGASALRVAEVAAAPGRLPERGEALLVELHRHLQFDAAWLASAEPSGLGYGSLASTSLDAAVVEYLSGPRMAKDIEATGADRDRAPLSPSDLPYAADELPTWAECLLPAGFHEAMAVPLFAPGRHIGFLALLSASRKPPTDAMRQELARLAPILARGVDPMSSLGAVARLVRGATGGVVLLEKIGTESLPGLEDDALLAEGSGVLDACRAALGRGHAYVSFLWPRGGRHAPDGHARVTALRGASDMPTARVGIVLISPPGDQCGLTPRELEVLGLLVEGRSNQQVARELVVAPRTVAAHVEHILPKLDATSRTLAAVRAQRTGLYVPRGAA